VIPVFASMLPLDADAAAPWPLACFAFWLGACVGSFLNVCIHRIPADESVVRPRSRCPRCGTQLAWYDNVPLVSWLVLRARCRTCRTRIAARYPLVEALTGALAVAVVVRFGPTPQALVAFAFAAALVLVTFVDLDHLFIPDEVSLPGILVGLGAAALPGGIGVVDAGLGALLGGGLLWAVAWTYERATATEGMGFGDVKLLAMIGAFLGWQAVPMVIVVASVVGSLAGVAALLTPHGIAGLRRVARRLGVGAAVVHFRRAARHTAIPFGPFLALGALVVLFAPALSLPWTWTAA
jgi:leader peptidase (prepilin peptidase)/N-methyltransferase